MKVNSKLVQALNGAMLMLIVGALIMYLGSAPKVAYIGVICYSLGHFMGRWTAPD